MATDVHELQGLRALVQTGGTKGIGRAIAARLRESGATVAYDGADSARRFIISG